MSPTRPFRDYLVKDLEDPARAATYLSVALEEYEADGNQEALFACAPHRRRRPWRNRRTRSQDSPQPPAPVPSTIRQGQPYLDDNGCHPLSVGISIRD